MNNAAVDIDAPLSSAVNATIGMTAPAPMPNSKGDPSPVRTTRRKDVDDSVDVGGTSMVGEIGSGNRREGPGEVGGAGGIDEVHGWFCRGKRDRTTANLHAETAKFFQFTRRFDIC
jgi:hypothetical protein